VICLCPLIFADQAAFFSMAVFDHPFLGLVYAWRKGALEWSTSPWCGLSRF
jgi:NADH:ubiquinone oxidoreductase subunit 3 (subunit A)